MIASNHGRKRQAAASVAKKVKPLLARQKKMTREEGGKIVLHKQGPKMANMVVPCVRPLSDGSALGGRFNAARRTRP